MPGLFSRTIASSTESPESPRQKHRQTGSRYPDSELTMEMDKHDHTQGILMKIRVIEKAAAAKNDIVGHILAALEAIYCAISEDDSSCTWCAMYYFNIERLGVMHNDLLVAMSGEDYSWGRSNIHAIASATSSLINSAVSAASGALEKS